MSTRSENAAEQQRSRWPFVGRWCKRLVVISLLAVLIALGALWWQERQLEAAATALKSGDTKYALYLITEYLEKHPDDVRARAIQARGLVKIGEMDAAIEIFDVIGPASIEDLHSLARAYMARKEWSSALGLLTRVLQMQPDNADVAYELASCQMQLGLYQDALTNATVYARSAGKSARGNVLIGSIHGLMRKDQDAANAFKKVLEEEPEAKNLQVSPAEFYLRYGRVLINLGKPREAIEMLKQCVAHESIGEAFVMLGDAASQLGEAKKAESAWKMAIKVEPSNRGPRISLANAALLARDGKQALQWLEPLCNSEQLSSAECYLFQRTYALLGDEKQAADWQARTEQVRKVESVRSAIEQFVTTNPESFWSRAARAHQFATEGNWQQAELLMTGLIEEAPGEPFIIELTDAIRRKSKLPELTRIPVVRH